MKKHVLYKIILNNGDVVEVGVEDVVSFEDYEGDYLVRFGNECAPFECISTERIEELCFRIEEVQLALLPGATELLKVGNAEQFVPGFEGCQDGDVRGGLTGLGAEVLRNYHLNTPLSIWPLPSAPVVEVDFDGLIVEVLWRDNLQLGGEFGVDTLKVVGVMGDGLSVVHLVEARNWVQEELRIEDLEIGTFYRLWINVIWDDGSPLGGGTVPRFNLMDYSVVEEVVDEEEE